MFIHNTVNFFKIWDFYWETSKAQVHCSVSEENETGENNWKQWRSATTMTWSGKQRENNAAVVFLSILNASQDFSF